MGWLSDYQHRHNLPINGSSGAGTGYSLPLIAHFDDYYLTTEGDGYVHHPFCRPAAAYYNGRTYLVFQGPKTTGDGDPYITYYDHSTGVWATPVRIAANPLSAGDKHGSPCILVRTDAGYVGKLLVAYGGHAANAIKWVQSANAEDISSWSAPANLGTGSFPKLVQLPSGGDLYCFYRTHAGADARYTGYRKMSAGTASWGAETDLLDWSAGGVANDELIASLPAYDATAGMLWFDLAQLKSSDGSGTAYLDHYVFGFKPGDGKVYDVAGNSFTVPVTKATFDNASYKFKAYAVTGNENTYPGALTLDENQRPHLIFGAYDGTSTYRQQHLRWDGSAWASPTTILSGTSSHIKINVPAVIQAAAADIVAFLTSNSLDMEEWAYNGTAWQKTRIVLAASGEPGSGSVLRWASVPAGFQSGLRVIFPQQVTGNLQQRLYAFGATAFVPWRSPGYVTCGGHAKTDFGDVRLTTDDGTTVLGYWFETDTKRDGNVVKIWVKVAANLDTDQSLYCYYGKADATYAGSILDAFIWGDDFELGNLSRWDTAQAQWSVQSGVKRKGTYAAYAQGAASNTVLLKNLAVSGKFLLHYHARLSATTWAGMFHSIGQGVTRYPFELGLGAAGHMQYYINPTYFEFTPGLTYGADTWYEIEEKIDLTNSKYKVKVGLTETAYVTTLLSSADLIWLAFLSSTTAGKNLYLDEVWVRKWMEVEPAWQVPGSAEPAGTSIARKFLLDVMADGSTWRKFALPIEVSGAIGRTYRLPFSFEALVPIARAFILEIDALSGLGRRYPLPFESDGDIVLVRRFALPVETVARLGRKLPLPIESSAGILSRQFLLPIEIRGGIGRPFHCPVEWRGDLVLRRKFALPLETKQRLARKLGLPVEASGLTDALVDYWNVYRTLSEIFLDEWTVIPVVQTVEFLDTWNVQTAHGMEFIDSWRVLPPQIVTLFGGDIQMPSATMEKD